MYSSPLPDIAWFSPENTSIQPSSKYSFVGGTFRRNLKIKTLSASDEGSYICSAINIIGKVEARIYLNVTCKYCTTLFLFFLNKVSFKDSLKENSKKYKKIIDTTVVGSLFIVSSSFKLYWK